MGLDFDLLLLHHNKTLKYISGARMESADFGLRQGRRNFLTAGVAELR
jgi:hypothetical protein